MQALYTYLYSPQVETRHRFLKSFYFSGVAFATTTSHMGFLLPHPCGCLRLALQVALAQITSPHLPLFSSSMKWNFHPVAPNLPSTPNSSVPFQPLKLLSFQQTVQLPTLQAASTGFDLPELTHLVKLTLHSVLSSFLESFLLSEKTQQQHLTGPRSTWQPCPHEWMCTASSRPHFLPGLTQCYAL